jgi:hypothetical protein
VAKSPPYPGYLTPAQVAAKAKALAAASLLPDQQAIKRQITDTQNNAMQQSVLLNGLYQAAADAGKDDASNVQKAYQTAGDAQAGYSKGYSETLNRLSGDAAADTNEKLAGLGNRPVTSNPNSDVAKYLGDIPAGTLAAAGAHGYAAANGAVAATRDLGPMYGTAAAYKGLDDVKALHQQLLDVEAKRPGTIQQMLQELGQQQNSLWATKIQQDYLTNTVKKTDAGITGTYVGADGKVYKTFEAWKAADDKHQKQVAAQTAAAAKKAAAHDKSVASKNAAFKVARRTIAGQVTRAPYVVTQKTLTGEKIVHMPYAEAKQRLWVEFGPSLMVYASQAGKASLQAAVEQMIDEILQANGFKA